MTDEQTLSMMSGHPAGENKFPEIYRSCSLETVFKDLFILFFGNCIQPFVCFVLKKMYPAICISCSLETYPAICITPHHHPND